MINPKVFTDFHHASLLQSLILLFEGRLRGAIYRPIGLEWATSAYWAVYDHPATQAQYLSLAQGHRPEDGTPPLNQFAESVPNPEPGTYYCQDIDSGTINKAITLDEFMRRDWDFVIASLPQHLTSFSRLCATHHSHPKLIYQIGNAWNVPENGTIKNVMASALINNVPNGINFVSYHQEFDLNVFKPTHFTKAKKISSFINCFNVMDHFKADYDLFLRMEKLMPDWEFKSYGGQCRDGAVGPASVLSETMQDARFIWHTKNGGDGYGHIAFNTGAIARPMIVKKEYYQGKLAEKLMIDGETCIAIDGLNPQEIINKINHYNNEENYLAMCANVLANFRKHVDFNLEASKIAEFLDRAS